MGGHYIIVYLPELKCFWNTNMVLLKQFEI